MADLAGGSGRGIMKTNDDGLGEQGKSSRNRTTARALRWGQGGGKGRCETRPLEFALLILCAMINSRMLPPHRV